MVFQLSSFQAFEVFAGPLGAHLGSSWADLVPKMLPKCSPKWSKMESKTDQKTDPNNKQECVNFGPKNGPPKWSTSLTRATAIFRRRVFKSSWSQGAPKVRQDGQKLYQNGRRWSQDGSRWPKIAKTSSKNCTVPGILSTQHSCKGKSFSRVAQSSNQTYILGPNRGSPNLPTNGRGNPQS
jgi:hypothetical protein